MRKIIVENEEWGFMIGKSNVVIKSPEGMKRIVLITEIKNITEETLENGRHKKTEYGMVKPLDIKNYIAKTLYIKEKSSV
jgi:hypothetical protein